MRWLKPLVWSITLLLAIAAGGYAWLTHAGRGERLELSGDALRLQGVLVDATVDQALALLDAHPEVRRLVVRSQGGDLRAAMRLGRRIHARGLDVEVDGYCLSACANYVFTAGRHKRIQAGAVVAWHGSAIQPDLLDGRWELVWRKAQQCETTTPECEVRIGALRDWMLAARAEQAAFFQQVGVDEQLTVWGQVQAPCACSWTFAPADLARFGLTQVSSDGPYFTQLGHWASLARDEAHIRLLSAPALAAAPTP